MKAYIGKDNTWGALITDSGQRFLFTFTANGSEGVWGTLPKLLPVVDMEEVSVSKMFEILEEKQSEVFNAHQAGLRERHKEFDERINRNKNH